MNLYEKRFMTIVADCTTCCSLLTGKVGLIYAMFAQKVRFFINVLNDAVMFCIPNGVFSKDVSNIVEDNPDEVSDPREQTPWIDP